MTPPRRRESELLLYTAPDGAVQVGVLFREETAWLSQKALDEQFGAGVPAVAKHLFSRSSAPRALLSRVASAAGGVSLQRG